MNYDTLKDLIDAGIKNATVLFNSDVDDATYNTTIPDWVKFNGVASSKLYYSSNSWIGLKESEQIRYHRQDTRMFKACIETGTVYGTHRFMRYYFNGGIHYQNYTIYEWEIFFFDTGDIMIHAINVPDIAGTYEIIGAKTYTYTAPTVENPYVTFYSQDENNSTFEVNYDIIELHKLQYLAKDTNNVIYTVEDDSLVQVDATELTTDVFKSYGCSYTAIAKAVKQITDVTIYQWCEYTEPHTDEYSNIKVTAIPYNQVIYSDNLNRPQVGTYVTVLVIENITIDYEGSPLIATSFDGGETWRAYKDKQWVHLEQENSGNTPAEIISISTPEWNEQFDVARQIRFRFTLTEGDSITNLTIHYINPAE
jgi:hypothetical protein